MKDIIVRGFTVGVKRVALPVVSLEEAGGHTELIEHVRAKLEELLGGEISTIQKVGSKNGRVEKSY